MTRFHRSEPRIAYGCARPAISPERISSIAASDRAHGADATRFGDLCESLGDFIPIDGRCDAIESRGACRSKPLESSLWRASNKDKSTHDVPSLYGPLAGMI